VGFGVRHGAPGGALTVWASLLSPAVPDAAAGGGAGDAAVR
jgi:hypothetical protein